jgi:hypothetical protein
MTAKSVFREKNGHGILLQSLPLVDLTPGKFKWYPLSKTKHFITLEILNFHFFFFPSVEK